MHLFTKTQDQSYLGYAVLNYHAAKIVLGKRDLGMVNESSRIRFNESSKGILIKMKIADSLQHSFAGQRLSNSSL
jgi:hypothetical protein